MNKIFSFFKSFFLAPLILSIFNLMAIGVDVFIPVSVTTILIVWILDIPGLILLIIFYMFIL